MSEYGPIRVRFATPDEVVRAHENEEYLLKADIPGVNAPRFVVLEQWIHHLGMFHPIPIEHEYENECKQTSDT